MKQIHVISLLVLLACSCEFFKQDTDREPIARVNDAFLYKDDISGLITENISKEDSAVRVNNYINQWATQQLLMNGARINLSQDKQDAFDNLVEDYKNDLYIKAYLEALVKRTIDTAITQAQAEEVYEGNLEAFRLNEDLLKFRYINLNGNNGNSDDIEERFVRFDEEDRYVLDSIAIQFKSYSLNDSIWIRLDQAMERIPILNQENKDELLKKSNFIRHNDSLGLYLMQINEVLKRNEIAPIEYVMPTIREMVINKRKLELIQQLEKDITKDAMQNKQFEIYD